MARIGKKADREHSGHYLSAVAFVAVVVAGLAWFGQNRTLAAAAAALGLYALHLFSIRFLLDNQKRQQRVLDAQWEVLQRFIDTTDGAETDSEDLVPAMPVDRESPERLVEAPAPGYTASSGTQAAPTPQPESVGDPAAAPAPEDQPGAAESVDVVPSPAATDGVVVGDVVPPAESLGAGEPGYALVVEDPAESATALTDLQAADELPSQTAELLISDEGYRPPVAEVPVPRHFALGTVALVRDLLSPAEVARVLLEQRRQPGKKFGVLAVEMGLLSESQREELLLAQQEGLFTDAEMRDARQRLREFRENAAHSMAGLD
jgi:hypothetical protein